MSSNKRAARAAVLLGALAVLAIPVAVLLSRSLASVSLLRSLYVGVPVSVGLGILSFLALRRARFVAARSVDPRTAGPLRTARVLAWAGLYAGVTGALALGVYGALIWAQ
jgi:hypothetical protein